jgi:hypothetical protein
MERILQKKELSFNEIVEINRICQLNKEATVFLGKDMNGQKKSLKTISFKFHLEYKVALEEQ